MKCAGGGRGVSLERNEFCVVHTGIGEEIFKAKGNGVGK